MPNSSDDEPNPLNVQSHQRRFSDEVIQAVISEKLTTLGTHFAEHVIQDNLFQTQITKSQADMGIILKGIEISLAGWQGKLIGLVAAISTVWGIVVLLINYWKA